MASKIRDILLYQTISTILKWLFPKLLPLIPPVALYIADRYYHILEKSFYKTFSLILIAILSSTILFLIPYIFSLRYKIKIKKFILPKGYFTYLNLIWDQDNNIRCSSCLEILQGSFLGNSITKEEDKSVYQCNKCKHKTILKNDKGKLITKDQAKKLKDKYSKTYKRESNLKIWLSFILILLVVALTFYLSIYKLCISNSKPKEQIKNNLEKTDSTQIDSLIIIDGFNKNRP